MFRAQKAASRQSRGGRMSLANRKSQIRMSMRAGGGGVRQSVLHTGAAGKAGPAKAGGSWVDHLNVGDVVWVNLGKKSDEPRWVHAIAESRHGKKITISLSESHMEKGDEKTMEVKVDKLEKIKPGNKTALQVLEDPGYTKAKMLSKGAAAEAGFADDMTQLNYINAPAIIHTLEGRAKIQDADETREKCFTYMANVLIAVNPCFNPDKKLVDPDLMSFVGGTERVPHPYAIAETAYQQMVSATKEDISNQSIVISGESGAGKTESSKIVLKHLTSRDNDTTDLDKRMMQSNPVLEAFGNAKTQRNNNSSRFGKFMKLEFSRASRKQKDAELSGGMIETYLLEKSRLVTAINGERNFHIFYQLLSKQGINVAGGDTQLGDKDGNDFYFLLRNECLTATGVNDGEEFDLVREGLTTVGMPAAHITGLLQLLSGILFLGNVEFEDESLPDGSERAVVSGATADDAAKAAQLLGVADLQVMLKVMTERAIKSVGETIVVQKDAAASGYSRNAVCKELYGRIFDWIIATINKSLGAREGGAGELDTFIGVLDIFGFECFKHNDFEQLLINYTNEVLQATFNQQVFQAETDLYRAEGLHVPPVQWPDNRECVELIANEKPPGVLMLLDAEMKTQKPSDIKFCKELHKQHGFNPYCPKPHQKDIQKTFNIKHFAGKVQYSIGNFIDKNNNSVPPETMGLFQASRLAELSPGSTVDPAAEAAAAAAAAGKRVKKKKVQTVGHVFRKQMTSLIETLQATKCSFIRCIKPNAATTFGVFDRAYVQAQVRCQGLLQTCEVLRLGLPTRVSYEHIATQFRQDGPAGLPDEVKEIFEGESDKAFVQAIIWAFGLDRDDFKLGLTRIFFRVGKMSSLRQVLEIDMGSPEGKKIAERLLYYIQYKRWRRAYAKVLAFNRFGNILKVAKAKRVAAATRVASAWRRKAAQKVYRRMQREKIENSLMNQAEQEMRELMMQEEAERQRLEAERLEAERKRLLAEAAKAAAEEKARLEAEAAEAERQRLAAEKAKAEAEEAERRAEEERIRAKEQQEREEREAEERQRQYEAAEQIRLVKAEKERKRREAEEQAVGQGDLIGGALDDDGDDDDSSDDDDDEEAADQRMYLVDSYRLCGVATTTADGAEASREELEENARRQFQAQTDQQFKALQAGGQVRASMAVEAGISRKGGQYAQEGKVVGGVDYAAATPLAAKMQQLNRMKELEWVTNKEYTKLAAQIYRMFGGGEGGAGGGGDDAGADPLAFPPLPANPRYQQGGGTSATAGMWDLRALDAEYTQMHTLRMQQRSGQEVDVDEWVGGLAAPDLVEALREAGMDVGALGAEVLGDEQALRQRLRFIHAPHDNEDLRWHVSQLECPNCERLNSTLRMVDGHRCRYCGEDVFTPDVVYIGAQNEYEPDHESYAAEGIRRALLTHDIRLKKFLAMDEHGGGVDEGVPPPPPGLAGKYTSEPSILAERLGHACQDASGGWGDALERLNGKPYFVQTESEETGEDGFFVGWSGESREAAASAGAAGHQIKLVTVVDDGSGARYEDDIHGCVGRLLEAVDELEDARTYEVEVQVWDEWLEGQPPPEARIKLLKLEGRMLREREMGHWVVAEVEQLPGLLAQAAQGVSGMRFPGSASSEGLMNPYIPAAIENSHWAQFTVEPEEEGMPSVPYEGGQLQISIYGSMEDTDSDPNSPLYGHKITEYVLLCRWGSGDEPVTPSRGEYCEHWLVAAGIKEFQEFHRNLRRQIKPVMPQGARMPKFVARLDRSDEDDEAEVGAISNKAKRLKRREEAKKERMEALLGYWKEVFEMLTVHSSLCNHLEALDKFLALDARIKEIQQTHSWQNETEEASDVVAPYGTREDLVNNCQKPIDMLERVLEDNQGDVRKSPGVQSLVRACLTQRQKLQATATSGPFTEPDLIPEAELLLEKLAELLHFYNDEAMSAQTGILGLVNEELAVDTSAIDNVEMEWNQGE